MARASSCQSACQPAGGSRRRPIQTCRASAKIDVGRRFCSRRGSAWNLLTVPPEVARSSSQTYGDVSAEYPRCTLVSLVRCIHTESDTQIQHQAPTEHLQTVSLAIALIPILHLRRPSLSGRVWVSTAVPGRMERFVILIETYTCNWLNHVCSFSLVRNVICASWRRY